MAWVEKYRAEFKDTWGLLWTTKIYEDGFSGDFITLKHTGQPLTFEYLGNSDDIYDPIQETEVKIRVFSETNFSLADLYATEQMHFKVEVYSTNSPDPAALRFSGFVDCGNYEEPYEDVPYEVTITACCGLKFLKEIAYDDNGTPYNGRLLYSEIFIDILSKIGYTIFYEHVNIYEESMANGTGDSPFDQSRIDVDLFRGMYCYDVLAELVKAFGATIRQNLGVYDIYRPVELKGSTVYGRYFASDTNKTGISFEPKRYIDRSTNAGYCLQVPGGVKMITDPAKKVTIHQDYGNKESWIDNFQFKGESFDIATSKFEDWTYPGSGVVSLIGSMKGEKDGIVLPATTGGPGANPILSQTIGTYAVATSDLFFIEFEYFVYSAIDAQDISPKIRIKADGSSHYLYPIDDNEAGWNATADYLDPTESVAAGEMTEWKTYRRYFSGLPTAGSYTIGLYNGTSTVSNAFYGVKNIEFYCVDDYINAIKVKKTFYPTEGENLLQKVTNWVFKKKKWVTEKMYKDLPEVTQYDWIKENSINGTELECDVMIGDVTKSGSGAVNIDNIIEQFAGALIVNERTLLQVVHTVTLTADSPDGTLNITCSGLKKGATFTTDLPGTAAKFVLDHNLAYAAIGITVTQGGAGHTEDIIFTGTAGVAFDGDTEITDVTGGLNGSVAITQPNAYSDALSYSTNWNTRGGSESKELTAILCDEIAAQFARPKQLIQMALRGNPEYPSAIPIYLLGCYEDDLNKYSGNNRKFVVGRGSFEVKERFLMIDLKEVI